MDSLTQLTFGAACGEAILGKKMGRKGLIWGAILGTLPDLDVFIPLGSPVDDLYITGDLVILFFSHCPVACFCLANHKFIETPSLI